MRQGNRVIGAGKFYWKPLGGTDWVEIGETQGGSINTTVEKKEAHDKSSVLNKVVAVVATAVSATIKFDTNIHSKENLELYMLGTSEDITYEIGDELPDGSTATAQIVIPRITSYNVCYTKLLRELFIFQTNKLQPHLLLLHGTCQFPLDRWKSL